MPKNFGLRQRNCVLPREGSPTHDPLRLGGAYVPSFSSIRETVAGGFLICFAVLCGSLFGVITYIASLIIEPRLDTQLVQYEHRVSADR